MEQFSCDVRALPADAAAVDALARLQVAASRAGFELRLCHASPQLRCLISFCGLDEVLRVEVERQPEQREERLGVEEEGQLDDPPVS
jgi:anti-anti-sigma regulatory factor